MTTTVTDYDGLEQLQNDLAELDTIEAMLYNELESGIASNTLSIADQQQLVTQIADIGKLKKNLLQTNNSMYSYLATNAENTASMINTEASAVKVMQDGIQANETKHKALQKSNDNAKRMVEINTYYGQKYSNYAFILKVLFCFVIAILFFTILNKLKLLPDVFYAGIVGIIFIVGLVVMGKLMLDAYNRDNFDYKAYYWSNTSNLPVVNLTGNLLVPPPPTTTTGTSGTCQNAACCSINQTFTNGLCTSPSDTCTSASIYEGFRSVASVYDQFNR